MDARFEVPTEVQLRVSSSELWFGKRVQKLSKTLVPQIINTPSAFETSETALPARVTFKETWILYSADPYGAFVIICVASIPGINGLLCNSR